MVLVPTQDVFCPKVISFWENMAKLAFSNMDEKIDCRCEFVNVGFHHDKFVCIHCNKEKGKSET